MKNFIEITISTENINQSEILIALLADEGYDGFEQEEQTLKAYIDEEKYKEQILVETLQPFNCQFQLKTIEHTNWNTYWEQNYNPIKLDDFLQIRASFHPAIPEFTHEIIINPKMSFGTGHHATTILMIEQMRKINIKDQSVLDYGTGTGILAIMAEKLGASKVLAIDNDEWSIENASENVQNNCCKNISVAHGETIPIDQGFDVVLGNINRNFLLENCLQFYKSVSAPGYFFCSGILTTDETDIVSVFTNVGFKFILSLEQSGWVSCCFQKHK